MCVAATALTISHALAANSDSVVVFSEVMYHPDPGDTTGEWIEIYNQMGVDVDISGWRLSGGIDYVFPSATVIGGGEFLVIAANPAALSGSLGPLDGALNNGGKTINLRDNSDRVMDSINYEDNWPWPPAADGSGASLTKTSPLLPTGDIRSWRASLSKGGSPGTNEDFASASELQISEVGHGGSPAFFIELHNPGSGAIPLLGIEIASSSEHEKYTFGAGSLEAGAFLSLGPGELGFTPDSGERIFLKGPGGSQILDGVTISDNLQARRSGDNAQDSFYTPQTSTPGAENSFDFEDAIVINEIMYHGLPTFPRSGIPPSYDDETVISGDAIWKYQQSGSFPGSNWMTQSFNDNSWPSGPATLGVESAGLPEPIRTGLTLGTITYYFRHTFNYSGDPANDLLQLRLLIDDGAIIYINGSEILREGLPEGPVDQNTLANSTVADATIQMIDLPENLLLTGENLIAVEVHQASSGSSDIVFGLEVISRKLTDPGIPDTPFTESREEWIELFNRSTETIDLSSWQLSDGIRFSFPVGTTLAPGHYLVIADDASAFAAAHPGVSVLGEYSGGLGNGSDRIMLLDARGNPADIVEYFDGGRWDSGADGHGPSLELMNPDADNSHGEAWRASDEAAKSTWSTYTYRAIADSPIPGDPAIWQDFALGMLDGEGEILIDDISVIQDPDGAAIERIQNGDFNGNSTAHWRLLGNHQRSFPEDDVLHLVASGATEYQGNQLETTFGSGASIVNGSEYEISFRARWLSGSSQLNTRLYFNRAAKTTQLEVPGMNGTPGAPNSRLAPNASPSFDSLTHFPLLPTAGQPVTVSTVVGDADGIEAVSLHYRPDGGAWQSTNMAIGANGKFSGTIPGQSANTVTQFYVEARNTFGAISSFPKEGANSRALLEVDDGVSANGAVHDLRAIMLSADSELLHRSTNSLSNELLGATVIYQGEAFYDVGIRLKGSFVGRDAARVGFNLKFNPDQLFRGVHEKIAIDRSTHGDLGVDEVIIKHVATRAGDIPGMYDDIVQFISPRSQYNRRALIRMAGFDSIYLDSQFEDGSDGTLFEFEVYRWATTTIDGSPDGLKRAGGLNSPNGFLNIPIRGYGDEKEDYRWHCLITSKRQRDDYRDVIPFLKTMGLNSTELEAEAPEVMNVDSILRTLAYQSLVGPGDSTFTGGSDHNFRLYARPDGKVMYLPWDWDSAFQRSTSAGLVGGGNFSKLVNRPANLRLYYGHLQDIIAKAFNRSYMSDWTSHYGALGLQNFSGRLSYIDQRANYVLGQLPAQAPFEITTNGGNNFSVFTSSILLSGEGWIDINEIRASADGVPLKVSWTDTDRWAVTLPLSAGANEISLLAFNRTGQQVGTDTVTVTNLSSTEAASTSNLAISELMYHPADDGEEFIEVMNIGQHTIDLTGVRFINGIEYAFDDGVLLESGERLVISSDQFLNQTRLSNSGEQIALIAGDGSTIRDMTYRDDSPWPLIVDGDGPSLVLINPTGNPDHALAMNWRPSVQIGGNPGTSDATTFSGAPDELIDYATGGGDKPIWLSREGTLLTLNYRQNLAADDVILRAQWSSDLITWNELNEQFSTSSPIYLNDGRQQLRFISQSTDRQLFVRLVATAR